MIPLLYLILLIITIIGIIIFRSLTYEKRLFINIPSGMILGVSAYIFLLNIFSKFFPGPLGIIISTISLLLIGITAIFYNHSKIIEIKWPKLLNFLVLLSITILITYFARLKMTSIFSAADSDMQWAYAASFARGNYPLKTSWQPDLNPNYHLGAYFFEGALLYLTNLPLITTHSLLNTFFLIAGCLFVVFILWEERYIFKNIWLVLALLITYISFGVIIFLYPSVNFLGNNVSQSDIISSLAILPKDISAKGTGGAALVDLNSLSFLPARSLSLGLAFLTLYLVSLPFKNYKLKILLFVLVFSTSALVEESMFLPMFLTLVGVLIFSLFPLIPKLEYLKKQRKVLLYITFITGFVVLLQGGFMSELAHQAKSNFNIYLPFSSTFQGKIQILVHNTLSSSSKFFNLFLPNPAVLALITLVYSLFKNRKITSLISIYSLIALFCYFSIEYKYSPTNNARFYSSAYISAGLGFIYFIYDLMKSKSTILNLFVFSITSFFITPSLLPEIINQSEQIQEARIKNIRSQILISSNPSTPFEKISDWANKNLPRNSRLLSIDIDVPSPKRSIQFEYKGLYTTLGPQYIHTTRPEPGPEYFDLVLTLNPSIIKQTKTEYVYVESISDIYKLLPQFRKDELENNNFFEKLQSIDIQDNQNKAVFFRLYKVLPPYLDPNTGGKEITEGTISLLNTLIPNSSTVYISDYGDPPQFSFWYRMAVILGLKDKQLRRNISQTDYQAIETDFVYTIGGLNQKYDFYILTKTQNPPYPAKLIWSNNFASAWKTY